LLIDLLAFALFALGNALGFLGGSVAKT
jgi:hypothetical protein